MQEDFSAECQHLHRHCVYCEEFWFLNFINVFFHRSTFVKLLLVFSYMLAFRTSFQFSLIIKSSDKCCKRILQSHAIHHKRGIAHIVLYILKWTNLKDLMHFEEVMPTSLGIYWNPWPGNLHAFGCLFQSSGDAFEPRRGDWPFLPLYFSVAHY